MSDTNRSGIKMHLFPFPIPHFPPHMILNQSASANTQSICQRFVQQKRRGSSLDRAPFQSGYHLPWRCKANPRCCLNGSNPSSLQLHCIKKRVHFEVWYPSSIKQGRLRNYLLCTPSGQPLIKISYKSSSRIIPADWKSRGHNASS